MHPLARQIARWLRDEEAAGSNPAGGRVAAYYRQRDRLAEAVLVTNLMAPRDAPGEAGQVQNASAMLVAILESARS